MDSKGWSGMDSTSKGRSLPSVPEALNPVSMKQPSEPLGGRMGRGGGDLGVDPALLMDKAAAQLAVTLQDSVLNQMASHGHSHERLKDLTSRMLNGDQDKLPKLCPPEPTILKGTEAPSSHPSPQRKATSPEIKLKITKMVSKGKPARFKTFCGEGPNLPTEDPLVPASRAGRKRRLIKPKPLHKLASNHDPVPVGVSAASQPEEGTAAPQQIQQASPLVEQRQEEELPVNTVFSVGDVVWTKVSGYPWWPCMVSTDPELNTHLKRKAINRHTSGILYHVQYFGNTPERGYIFQKNMASFSREEQYVELCHGNKQPSSRVFHRKSTTSSVPRKLHAQWVVGITQAKEAASLALEERLAKYTFTYDTNGPHLNPRLLAEHVPAEHVPAELGPAEHGLDLGPEQTKAQTPDQELSRLTLLSPSPTSPQAQPTPTDCRTSLEKEKSGSPRTTDGTEKQGKRKQTTSTLKKETTKNSKVLVSHKGQTEMPSQKQKKSKLKSQLPAKTGRKRSKGVALTTNMLETLSHAPIAKKDPQKKQLPCKQALEIDEDKDQQPKKKRGVGDKQKAVSAESSAPTKKRNRKKTETHVKGFTSSKELEKTKPIRKRRLDSASQLAASQTKKRKRAAASPEPEGSGIEERPESSSDSIDQTNGAKKTNGGGPKKESVCQVCEQAGEDVVPCEGQCCGSFHLSCLGSTLKPKDKLLCPDCTSGKSSVILSVAPQVRIGSSCL
ncbi:histone-lysine N-methyltransferase NSD2 isoform X2 [Oncorhynchus kisutch]|uniref:histone-lysine N-methyltransferase NSD2 isoform X2 n=1 Tax=Oncorhynchus kisutch TaxID=8019 RepID=UPI0012DC8FEE|nr:histone-lysine N-methyltransferase NSD2-like isoform X2 [Oncorhynchus kisutch]